MLRSLWRTLIGWSEHNESNSIMNALYRSKRLHLVNIYSVSTSQFGVLKNCGAQTNWFAADYSEAPEVVLTPTDGISGHFYVSQSVLREMATFFFKSRRSTWTPTWTCCNFTQYHKLSTYSHTLFCNKMVALPHCGLQVHACLDRIFPWIWIGRDGPMPWPPRSPDITPLDFFSCGVMSGAMCSEHQLADTSRSNEKNFQSFTVICCKPHVTSSICLGAKSFQNPE
jgi:hypothetical protein